MFLLFAKASPFRNCLYGHMQSSSRRLIQVEGTLNQGVEGTHCSVTAVVPCMATFVL